MSLYVIRDRETGAFYCSDQIQGDYFEEGVSDKTQTFGNEGTAKIMARTFATGMDVIELRPFTGQIEAEYLRFVHTALGHPIVRGDVPATECKVHECEQLRERLGL